MATVGRLIFPNPHGFKLPLEEEVLSLQKEYGFSDAYAHFLLTQNGLDAMEWPFGEHEIPVNLDFNLEEGEELPEIRVLYGVNSSNASFDLGTILKEGFQVLLPYFLPIGKDFCGNPYVEVRLGQQQGCIGSLDHEIFLGSVTIQELFEDLGEDYNAMTEEERVAFLTDEETGLLWIHAPSMKEFTESCLYAWDDQVAVYDYEKLTADKNEGTSPEDSIQPETAFEALDPNWQEVHKLSKEGERLLQQSNFKQALQSFEKALALCKPGDAYSQYDKLYSTYGCVYSLSHLIFQVNSDEKEKLIDADIKYSEQALDMADKPGMIRTTTEGLFHMEVNRYAGNELGWWMMERGNLGQALLAIERAVECIDDYSQYFILDTQVRILLKLGRTHEAFLIVYRVLAEWPDFDDFQDIKHDEAFRQWRAKEMNIADLYDGHKNRKIGIRQLYRKYEALSNTEINELIDLVINNDDDPEDNDILLYLALYSYACGDKLPIKLYEYLLSREICYPVDVYLRADESVAEKLISVLEKDNVGVVLPALCAIPCETTKSFLLKNSEKPLPEWAESLNCLPIEYSKIFGWDVDENKNIVKLYSEAITVFEKCEKTEASPLSPVKALDEVCAYCHGPITLVFNDAKHKLGTCLNCSCVEIIFIRQKGDHIHWHEKNAPQGFFKKHPEYMTNREAITFDYGIRPTEEQRKATYAANESAEISRTQIGGMLTNINDVDYPKCIDCGKTMKFVAQFDMADVQDCGEGIYYFFTCERCNVHAANYGQT